MIEVKLYKSPWKALLLLISSGAFVALFIFLMSIKGPKLMAILGLVFFGFGVCVALFHLFDRRPQIIINEIGIFDRTIHDQFINWELIRNAYTFDVHGQKFISLKIDDNSEVQISECPNGHGKIKSPMCCGEDMSCTTN